MSDDTFTNSIINWVVLIYIWLVNTGFLLRVTRVKVTLGYVRLG